MSAPSPVTRRLKIEVITFVALLIVGLVVVPVGIFWTGAAVFEQPYSDVPLGEFLSRLFGDLLRGAGNLWFLVLAPYLVWQCLRVSLWGVRR